MKGWMKERGAVGEEDGRRGGKEEEEKGARQREINYFCVKGTFLI